MHERNRGVGAAIVTGYQRALAERMDATAVMAGDNQMDPDELEGLALPVVRGELDYAKANRLFTGSAWQLIPRSRYLGNAIAEPVHEDRVRLLARRRLAGRLHGDLAADAPAARPRPHLRSYGFPNDMLVHLNVWNARVRDFPSRPIYGVGERSGIKIRRGRAAHLVAPLEGLLLAAAREVRDPRLPSARLLLLPRLPDDDRRARARRGRDGAPDHRATSITPATIVLVALLLISGSQFTLFAMWFDMESNKDLR